MSIFAAQKRHRFYTIDQKLHHHPLPPFPAAGMAYLSTRAKTAFTPLSTFQIPPSSTSSIPRADPLKPKHSTPLPTLSHLSAPGTPSHKTLDKNLPNPNPNARVLKYPPSSSLQPGWERLDICRGRRVLLASRPALMLRWNKIIVNLIRGGKFAVEYRMVWQLVGLGDMYE